IATNQDELAIGGRRSVARIVDFVEREVPVEATIDEGDERLLVPSVHQLFGRKGDHGGVRLGRDLQRLRDGIFSVYGIGICEEQPISCGVLRAEPYGVVLANPARRESSGFEE